MKSLGSLCNGLVCFWKKCKGHWEGFEDIRKDFWITAFCGISFRSFRRCFKIIGKYFKGVRKGLGGIVKNFERVCDGGVDIWKHLKVLENVLKVMVKFLKMLGKALKML